MHAKLLEITTVDISENEDWGLSLKKETIGEKTVQIQRCNREIEIDNVDPKGTGADVIAAAVAWGGFNPVWRACRICTWAQCGPAHGWEPPRRTAHSSFAGFRLLLLLYLGQSVYRGGGL